MTDIDPAARPPRRRGAQPGNLNAFKAGRYSKRLAASYRIAAPGDMRNHLIEVVGVVVRLELSHLGPNPTSAEHAAAVHRAIHRIGRAMASRNYREARSPREVLRRFHAALDDALHDAAQARFDPPPPARRDTQETLENEGNE